MSPNRLSAAIFTALLAAGARRLCAQDVSIGGRLGLVGGAVWFEDKEGQRPHQADARSPDRRRCGIPTAVGRFNPGRTLVRAEGLDGNASRRRPTVGLRGATVLLTVTAPRKTAPQLIAGASASLELACSVTGVPEVGSVSCDDPRVEWQRRKAQVATWPGIGVRRPVGRGHFAVQFLGNLNLTSLSREQR